MRYTGDIIRLILTLVIIAFVYKETGWATALFAFLMAARCEVLDHNAERTFRMKS